MNNPQFREMPATMMEFIERDEYLGAKEDTYEVLKKILCEVVGGPENRLLDKSPYSEAVFVAGIGSGKSFGSQVLLAYMAHWLLCLKDPFSYFGLRNDKPIVLINMGLTATQAKNVVFAGLKQMVGSSPWFKKFNNKILSTEMLLDINKETLAPILHIISGNSQETTPIGMSVFGGVLDEAAYYYDSEGKSVAENIYTTIQRRINSRFKGIAGLTVIISSPLYPEDFVMRKYDESKKYDFIYGVKAATWEVQDRDKLPKETFNFVVSRDPITNEVTEELKDIPINFKKDFDRNDSKALRDYAAIPSLSIQGFFRDPNVIDASINRERTHPMDSLGRFTDTFYPEDPSVSYYIHVDLALGKETGDACGIAMGHLSGYEEVRTMSGIVERRPKIVIDYMEALRAEPGQELDFSEIRQRIFDLKSRGFAIKKVTYDGWQSRDSQQILKKKGINSEELSVDRTMEPYTALKEAIMERRLDYYYYQKFVKELKTLEEIKGKKVDHAPGSSKDVADAVAGVVYNCISNVSDAGFIVSRR